jgi:hypothetical protein
MEIPVAVVHFLGVFCRIPFGIKKIVKNMALKARFRRPFEPKKENPWTI